MELKNVILLLAFVGFASVEAKSKKLECFVNGDCADGFHIDSIVTNTQVGSNQKNFFKCNHNMNFNFSRLLIQSLNVKTCQNFVKSKFLFA